MKLSKSDTDILKKLKPILVRYEVYPSNEVLEKYIALMKLYLSGFVACSGWLTRIETELLESGATPRVAFLLASVRSEKPILDAFAAENRGDRPK